MRCHLCDLPAVIGSPARCREHFVGGFEQKVRGTIERFDLIRPGQRIAVAASGGKDSLTVLSLLKRWYGDVTAITVDEGIAGYREHTLADLRAACGRLEVPLVVASYKELTGFTLDEILARKRVHACAVCGVLRRHLIALASKGFDVLATGHNADDEAQTVLMNLLRANTGLLLRNGPKTGVGARGFTQRVKPLYLCSEKEVMTYAYLMGLTGRFTECPNACDGYRWMVRGELNAYEAASPGARMRLLERFLAMREAMGAQDVALLSCERCGEPCAHAVCKACEMVEMVRAQ